jgi:hypothetical protein
MARDHADRLVCPGPQADAARLGRSRAPVYFVLTEPRRPGFRRCVAMAPGGLELAVARLARRPATSHSVKRASPTAWMRHSGSAVPARGRRGYCTNASRSARASASGRWPSRTACTLSRKAEAAGAPWRLLLYIDRRYSMYWLRGIRIGRVDEDEFRRPPRRQSGGCSYPVAVRARGSGIARAWREPLHL